jgi:hypothetical protein
LVDKVNLGEWKICSHIGVDIANLVKKGNPKSKVETINAYGFKPVKRRL